MPSDAAKKVKSGASGPKGSASQRAVNAKSVSGSRSTPPRNGSTPKGSGAGSIH